MERHDADAAARYVRLEPLGKWVNEKVELLVHGGVAPSGIRQPGYLSNGSYATAALAKLRRGAGHAVGDDPDIFEWTLPGPDELGVFSEVGLREDEPTASELAAHAAMTLFAIHQQSVHDMSMHTRDNISLGRAVGRMAFGNINEAGIRRSFDRLQTAGSWKELTRHARELVSLLKRERISLNYGLLAQDLVRLRAGRDSANSVRLRWGRDYHRAYRASAQTDSSDAGQ